MITMMMMVTTVRIPQKDLTDVEMKNSQVALQKQELNPQRKNIAVKTQAVEMVTKNAERNIALEMR